LNNIKKGASEEEHRESKIENKSEDGEEKSESEKTEKRARDWH
jgi:hypothetical protein